MGSSIKGYSVCLWWVLARWHPERPDDTTSQGEWEAGDDYTDGWLGGTAEKNLSSQQFAFENGPALLL